MKTILVVDDEKFLCLSLSRLLRKHGYAVECVANGNDAIAAITRGPSRFDLALIDLHMPELGGEETAKRLRTIAPALKIAMMTGYSPNFSPPSSACEDGRTAVPTLENGETLLFKPFEDGIVIQTVETLLKD